MGDDRAMRPGHRSPFLTRPLRRPARWAFLCMAVWLGGCALPHPEQLRPGQDEAAVRLAMGEPSLRYPLPDGAQRLAYVQGPRGLQTWFVDLDAQGHVLQVLQALTPARFAQVRPGMNGDALLRWLGPPAERQREYMDKQTWSWRYDNPQCLWARITLNARGQVIEGASFPMDPRCEVFERGAR